MDPMFHIFCIHYLVEGYLVCFQILDIIINTAMNMVEQMQEDQVRGRKEESKKRDTVIEGAITSLKRNLALGKCPEIYNVDPN